MAKQPDFTVEAAVRRDLTELAKRDRRLAESGLAAAAVAMAREIDSENSATSKSMCGKTLREILSQLYDLAPPEETKDGLDELSSRRERRIAGRSAT